MSASRSNWTEKEDEIIQDFVLTQNLKKWTKIAKAIQTQLGITGRTGKQCRERWQNHLDPSVSKDEWTPEEEQKIFSLQTQLGNKWREIASFVPGRTENSVKNCFYSALRRNLRKFNKNKLESQKLKGPIKSLLRKPASRAILMGIKPEVPQKSPKKVSKSKKIQLCKDAEKPIELFCPGFSPLPSLRNFRFPRTPSTTQSVFSNKFATGFFNFEDNEAEALSTRSDIETQTDLSISLATTPKYFLPHFSPRTKFQHYVTPRNSK